MPNEVTNWIHTAKFVGFSSLGVIIFLIHLMNQGKLKIPNTCVH